MMQHSALVEHPGTKSFAPPVADDAGPFYFQRQSWGGYPSNSDLYSPPNSPHQQRQIHAFLQSSNGPGQRQDIAHQNIRPLPKNSLPGLTYMSSSTPGPPIQTTPSNKGPDGANLFIFHIPNHFTNLDMYHLFCHYGNLLSVRIMVEKDTGRSRGFGFVSYDSREAAAMAIKELNGFVIGNKRLKVQHKQMRVSDYYRPRDQSQSLLSEDNEVHTLSSDRNISNEKKCGGDIQNLFEDNSQNEAAYQQLQTSRNNDFEENELNDAEGKTIHEAPAATGERNQPDISRTALSSLDQIRDALPEVEK